MATALQTILTHISTLGTKAGTELRIVRNQVNALATGQYALDKKVETEAFLTGGLAPATSDSIIEFAGLIEGENAAITALQTKANNAVLLVAQPNVTPLQKGTARANLGITDTDVSGLNNFNPTATFLAALNV